MAEEVENVAICSLQYHNIEHVGKSYHFLMFADSLCSTNSKMLYYEDLTTM